METNTEKLVLSYYYRRRRVQKKYDKLYGKRSRIKRKVLRKLKERKKKQDIKWKMANIIVRTAYDKRYIIVLEKLGKHVANNMISRISDKQLRYKILQASFRGIQRAIEGKAKKYGVPVVYVNPKNTSKLCPIHNAPIIYGNGPRRGKCSKGGEIWHRDVTACWNLLLRAHLGDGSNAPNLGGLSSLDGSPVPLGSTATHDPIQVPRPEWVRWNSLGATMNLYKMNGMNT